MKHHITPSEIVMGPVRIPEDDGYIQSLQCPQCGPEEPSWLHQRRVIVKNRFREDGDGMIVCIDGHHVNVMRVGPEKMDGRRDSLWIEFECEICHAEHSLFWWLEVQQHKGATHCQWHSHPPAGVESFIP